MERRVDAVLGPGPARRPRILHLALGCLTRLDAAKAVAEGWGARVGIDGRFAIVGDDKLQAELGEVVWPCVRAGSKDDSYGGLPLKILAGYARALANPDWDFLFKCDDDTFVVPHRLRAIVEEYDPSQAAYVGGKVIHAASSTWNHAALNSRGPWEIPFASGGAGYVLSRPALERAWPELERLLSLRGAEDVFTGAALARAGVVQQSHPQAFRARNDLQWLRWSWAATLHYVPPDLMTPYSDLHDRELLSPITIASATTGRGDVGLQGALGFNDMRVSIEGVPWHRAIAAHAPSRVVIRAEAGLRLLLRGAFDDSIPDGLDADATFHVETRDGRALTPPREGSRHTPTPWVETRVPPDGRVVLVARTSHQPHCHSVWLWQAPDLPDEAS